MNRTSIAVADTLVPAFESLDEIAEALTRRGSALYGGEPVTPLAHALQCATLAEDAGGGPALITAALLHDIGRSLAHFMGIAGRVQTVSARLRE
jgi:predicted HD phosphohydrolase